MEFKVAIKRDEFSDGMGLLLKIMRKKRAKGEAVLSLEKNSLKVSMDGMTVSFNAEGVWPGQVRLSGQHFLNTGRIMPSGDPIVFQVEAGDETRLAIGQVKILCAVQAVDSNLIDMPVNPTLKDYLVLSDKYTEAEIGRSGISGPVAEAREQKDGLIRRALEILKPLGVTMEDISAIVTRAIKR